MISDQVILLSNGYVVAEGQIHGVRDEMPGASHAGDRSAARAPACWPRGCSSRITWSRFALHADGGGLLVKTRDADRFYRALNHLALDGIGIESVAPADDNVNSRLRILDRRRGEHADDRAVAQPNRPGDPPGDAEDVFLAPRTVGLPAGAGSGADLPGAFLSEINNRKERQAHERRAPGLDRGPAIHPARHDRSKRSSKRSENRSRRTNSTAPTFRSPCTSTPTAITSSRFNSAMTG